MLFHPAIDSMLSRQKETNLPLSLVMPIGEEEGELGRLWTSLTTPVYHVLAEYPVNGEYQQQDSGVQCRFADVYHMWLCCDDDLGFYLVSEEEAENWALEGE